VVRAFDVGPFRWSPGHRGVDLAPAAGAQGVPVLSAGPGVVRFAGVVAGRGVVSVDHGSGVRTTYEPVTAGVRAGALVTAGQPLGALADGGHCAPAACLHWGAIVDDRYVDPLTLLRPREPPVLLPVPAAGAHPG
jgi:murein DD-endopeptidase MepM/ murein hydrolase activator NlpD